MLFSCLLPLFVFSVVTHDRKLSRDLEFRSYDVELAIMSDGQASFESMVMFFMAHNSRVDESLLNELTLTYMSEADAEGVNYDIAFVQMCHETGFLKFGNQVRWQQHNYCGLGATDDGARGAVFKTMRDGVRAHIQHLKAYASTDALNNELIDPRFKFVKRGSAATIVDLPGRWASDPEYDQRLVKYLKLLKTY